MSNIEEIIGKVSGDYIKRENLVHRKIDLMDKWADGMTFGTILSKVVGSNLNNEILLIICSVAVSK